MAEIVWEGALKLRNCDGLRSVIFRVRQRALNASSFVALTRTVAVKYGWFRKQVHKKSVSNLHVVIFIDNCFILV